MIMHNIRLHYGIFKQNLSILILTPISSRMPGLLLVPFPQGPWFSSPILFPVCPFTLPLPQYLSFPSNGFICSSFIADIHTRPRLHIDTYRNSSSWTPHWERASAFLSHIYYYFPAPYMFLQSSSLRVFFSFQLNKILLCIPASFSASIHLLIDSQAASLPPTSLLF